MAKKTTTGKAAKKVVSKQKTTATKIIAQVDVGFGNTLYIRGEGAGLSWEKGTALKNMTPYEWVFTCPKSKGSATFKFLINDEIWAEGENLTIKAGDELINSPTFTW